MFDLSSGASDLSRNKGLAPARRLVIEQDAATREHAVAFAIVYGDVVRKELRAGIWAARMEIRPLILGRRGCSEHFTGGRLVEFALDAGLPDSFQQTESARCRHVRSVLRHV